MHLLLRRYSAPLAWLSSLMTLYVVVWIAGDYQCSRLTPITIDCESLHLRAGLRWSADIPLTEITGIDTVTDAMLTARRGPVLKCAMFGDAQFLIRLKSALAARGPFGFRKGFRAAAVSVDEPGRFKKELLSRLGRSAV